MGVQIVTDKPPASSDYDNWKLYKSTTKTGSYSVINGATGQAVTDMTYYDEDGLSTSWYKVSYYNTDSTKESALSDPIQGQSTVYTTLKKVESLLQLPTRSDSTNPSILEIVQVINRMEDQIDYRTHHAWRLRYSGTDSGQDTTAKYETFDVNGLYEYQTGRPVYLKHRQIREMDVDEGDALEFWNGAEWEDWLTTKTEGRNSDYWFDYARGILYLKGYWAARKNQALRIKYRYGETFVNLDIEDIATKLAAIDILTGMDPRSMIVQEGENTMTHDNRVSRWRRQVNDGIARHQEYQFPSFG